MGDYAFGKPSRLTARIYSGKAGIVQIDRDSQLAGNIHNKGVMIFQGFFGHRFAGEKPISFSASLTFEQLYDGVDGDSASSTELYCLLSALARVPLRQDLAVTGSVNQLGYIQAIGGVNEKINGWFNTCKIMGLTGKQGVMIPEANVRNLMLDDDVVEAVAEGQFHIYPVSHIDEGIELLTGMPAGAPEKDGAFAVGSINYRVQKQLENLSRGMLETSAGADNHHPGPSV
jgi:predicted ATP-dependent protease